MEERKKTEEAAKILNETNPMSTDFGARKPGETKAATTNTQMPTESTGITKYLEYLKHPAALVLMNLASQPEFLKIVGELVDHPRKRELIYTQVGMLIFLILFRAWRASQIQGWFRKLWMSIWTFAIFLVLSSYVAPRIILGEPYLKLTGMVYAVSKEAWIKSQKKGSGV